MYIDRDEIHTLEVIPNTFQVKTSNMYFDKFFPIVTHEKNDYLHFLHLKKLLWLENILMPKVKQTI